MKTFFGLCLLGVVCLCTTPVFCEPSPTAPAQLYAVEGQPSAERMLHYADSMLTANPKDMVAWTFKIASSQLLGRNGDAFNALQSALNVDSNSVELAMLTREIYAMVGKKEEGERIFKRIMAAHPEAAAQQAMMESLMDYSYGNPQEALSSVSSALELQPADADLWKEKGEILSELGKYEDALTSFEKAIELDPAMPRPTFDLACIHAALGHQEKALEELSKAITAEPTLKDIVREKDCFKSLADNPDFKKLIR